ncbi:hypothetical protein GCM10027162_30970 [Streptomyces incanus]
MAGRGLAEKHLAHTAGPDPAHEREAPDRLRVVVLQWFHGAAPPPVRPVTAAPECGSTAPESVYASPRFLRAASTGGRPRVLSSGAGRDPANLLRAYVLGHLAEEQGCVSQSRTDLSKSSRAGLPEKGRRTLHWYGRCRDMRQ